MSLPLATTTPFEFSSTSVGNYTNLHYNTCDHRISMDNAKDSKQLESKSKSTNDFAHALNSRQLLKKNATSSNITADGSRSNASRTEGHSHVLLDLARIVCEEQCKLTSLTHKIMKHAQQLLQCCKCQIFLLTTDSKDVTLSQVFEYEPSADGNELPEQSISSITRDSDVSSEIISYISSTGCSVIIPDELNNHQIKVTLSENQSILAVPIQSANQRVIGVFQLTDKVDGSHFTKNDEQIFEAFAFFCGIGIENTIMYENIKKAQAKQSVALETLSYHAVASKEEARQLKDKEIPSLEEFSLLSFSFDDFKLDEQESIEATIRMFKDLHLIEKFRIDYQILCQWLLSVKKNYREVAYHNWNHAFNVSQCMFATLKTGGLLDMMSDLEVLCLLVACLCHDLDHRGTNNQFQKKIASPLATLYSTSVMEHHHFSQCIMLLSAEGTQILSRVEPSVYSQAIKLIEHAILATDLEIYFRRREKFFSLVDNSPEAVDWQEMTNRELLFSMMMTSCDIAGITKPWPIQQKVAGLIAHEFFEQGDLEREKLNTKPVIMMDRSKGDQIPVLQVQFIDTICLPLYQRVAKLSPKLQPLLDGCLANRQNWSDEAESVAKSQKDDKQK